MMESPKTESATAPRYVRRLRPSPSPGLQTVLDQTLRFSLADGTYIADLASVAAGRRDAVVSVLSCFPADFELLTEDGMPFSAAQAGATVTIEDDSASLPAAGSSPPADEPARRRGRPRRG